MDELRKKEKIKACAAISIIILLILTTCIIIFKYQVEGENNIPFKLSKIMMVSTAEGIETGEQEGKWNLSIFQNNDIYFSIEKNEKNKEENMIESISIENIQVIKNPEVGKIVTYMPNSSDGRLFNSDEASILQTNSLTYKGASKSNSKTLEIGNQGGTVVIRFSNTELGKYISDDEEVKHDGSLISKIGLNEEQIKFNVTFDLVINLKNKSYIAPISLEMPSNEDLIQNGTCSKEITDGFIFKRVTK